jgi:hypothetical protein
VLLKTGKRSKYTKFPVYPTRNELVGAMKGGTIRQASEAIADLIVNVIEPYEGGNGEAIFALHELNILDKHMLLLPVVQVGVVHGMSLQDDRGHEWTNLTVLAEDGRVYFSNIPLEDGSEIKVTDNGKPTVTIFFDKGLVPVENKPVLPTLIQLAQIVSDIVKQFERLV